MSIIHFPHLTQQQSLRDVTTTNFANGIINFKFGEYGSQWRWNPSKSFFRIRLKFSDINGDQPSNNLDLAPNMFCLDNLWQKINMEINSVSVSSVDDYVAQVASLKRRMMSNAYLETVEKAINFSEPSHSVRMNRITSNGVNFENDESFEFFKKDIIGLSDDANVPFLSTMTASYVVATGTLTFADPGVGDPPDIRQIFRVGDVLEIDVGNNNTILHKITILSFTNDRVLVGVSQAGGVNTGVVALSLNNIYLTQRKIKPRANSLELVWFPCLGFWNVDQWLPSGSYNMKLTPHPKNIFQRYVIESNRDLSPITDFKVEVENLLLYTMTGTSEPSKDGIVPVHYDEIRLQMQSLTTTSLNQKTFVINPKTHSITLAYQDNQAGESTQFSRSKFKIRNDEEQQISRFYLRKGGYELPTPKPDPNLRDAGKQFIAQIYFENLLYSGQLRNLGGQESIDKYLDRGLYYHYQFEEGTDDDRIYVSQQFDQVQGNLNQFTTNPNVLLFDHYYRSCQLHVKNGMIYKVLRSAIN